MDRRRRGGLIAMAGGLVAALVGELASGVTVVAVTFAALATIGFIGGGVAVALSYREEAHGVPSVSRLSLFSMSASSRMRRRPTPAGGEGTAASGPLLAYAALFNDELARGEALLETSTNRGEVDAARDRIVRFVANPLYGAATRGGLVDEQRVHQLSSRLAAAL